MQEINYYSLPADLISVSIIKHVFSLSEVSKTKRITEADFASICRAERFIIELVHELMTFTRYPMPLVSLAAVDFYQFTNTFLLVLLPGIVGSTNTIYLTTNKAIIDDRLSK